MTSSLISDRKDFLRLCREIHKAGSVAFDTEFVSEHTYRPDLGLLQFAAAGRLVAVDPYEVGDLAPWWEIMADDETTVITHGGQAEIRFCLTLFSRRPQKLVDVQLAEAFCSGSYPISYSALVRSVLGQRVHGGETRTDWRKRPLSDRQLEYALEDVGHLSPIWERQRKKLVARQREGWFAQEVERLIDDIESDLKGEPWKKLSGTSQLNRRELAVLRELAAWRERSAVQTNRPPRRIIRDDLLVEMARRQPASMKDLMRTRDMNRPAYRKLGKDLLECIRKGRQVPDADCPQQPRKQRGKRVDDRALAQFLGMVLANRCAELDLSKQIVATSDSLKRFIRWHNSGRRGNPPALATGWRAEVCGDLLTDILEGKISIHVEDPSRDSPLAFEPRE